MIVRKENIHENRIKCSNVMQITLDDDFNVPDSKPDIDNIVKERGIVHIESAKAVADKADVIGILDFAMLYTGSQADKKIPVSMTGSLNFNEKINLSEEADNTYITAQARLEDITVKAVNSRKISVKAVVEITVICEELEDVLVGNMVEEFEEQDDIQILKSNINYCQLALNQKDNLRIKENISLTAGKPDMAQILWDDIDIRSFNTRLENDKLLINGQINVFVMYSAADDGMVQWFETVKDFDELPLLDIKKPRVGLVGEILVKFHPTANNQIVDIIEREGGEAVMPDLIDFFQYCFYSTTFERKHYNATAKAAKLCEFAIKAVDFLRKDMIKALEKSKRFDPPASIEHLADKAKEVVSIGNQTGEGWFLTGEMIELIESGAPNIVCMQPFGCLPNHVTGKGAIKALRKKYPQSNIVAVDYDPGASEVNQLNRIKLMLSTAFKNLDK